MTLPETASLPMEKALTPREAAGILRVSVATVYRLVQSGRLRAFVVGRSIRIQCGAVMEFQERETIAIPQLLANAAVGRISSRSRDGSGRTSRGGARRGSRSAPGTQGSPANDSPNISSAQALYAALGIVPKKRPSR
jgi:excisionase family DNA binding protein